ncbi:MAG: AbrB/MazE/SpoVT family DNA-binding domain-containing protein [Sulfolobales archaeon]
MRVVIRHVITVGRRSLAIVIPKRWAVALGLRKGDKVAVKLNRNRSIVIRPVANAEDREEVDVKCPDIEGASIDEKITVKEMLSAYILGLSSKCIGAGLGLKIQGLISSPSKKDEVDIDSFIEKALDHAEDAVETLNRFVRDFDEKYAEKIHEIEDKMDLLFYSFIRISAQNVIESLSRGIGARDIAWHMLNAILIKTLEDLIDSIDRLIWRIHDSRASSRELVEIISNIERLTRDIVSCIRYPCDSNEVKDYYDKMLIIKRILREKMIFSPQPIQPALAEVVSIVNSIEDLIEITLAASIKKIVDISAENRLNHGKYGEG